MCISTSFLPRDFLRKLHTKYNEITRTHYGNILWKYILETYCGKTLWKGIVELYCGKTLWNTSCGSIFGKYLWKRTVELYCGHILCPPPHFPQTPYHPTGGVIGIPYLVYMTYRPGVISPGICGAASEAPGVSNKLNVHPKNTTFYNS